MRVCDRFVGSQPAPSRNLATASWRVQQEPLVPAARLSAAQLAPLLLIMVE